MGRRPNSLILQYFERGPKLADNSNRYPHTCKACGENFPKGRIDSLTNHLTKKCPAISEADRINACLTLHGINHASQRSQKGQSPQPNGPPVDLPMIQRDWTALETLAEVSRQIEANEKHDDRGPGSSGAPSGSAAAQPGATGAPRIDVQEPFTLENPPVNRENHQGQDNNQDLKSSPAPNKSEQTEENSTATTQNIPDSVNLSMAAAATARLNPSLLDPQLLGGEEVAHVPANQPVEGAEEASALANGASQPWGEITYMTEAYQPPRVPDVVPETTAAQGKGTFRMETGSSVHGSRARHSRARFDATRRKEVQEVRKIGACIRCRILRKTCSKGHPCDTCRKVLSPRVWRSGCVRTKFSEQLDLYSAGVQIVLAQHRINTLKSSMALSNRGTIIQASHFPDSPVRLSFDVLQRNNSQDPSSAAEPSLHAAGLDANPIVMIDNDTQDVPGRIETYMREILPEFAEREPSHFMKITLETALRIVAETNDDLLKKALELWGLVEILDRERQWSIRIQPENAKESTDWIKDETHQEVFTTICLQLAAAAERKAAATSKSLLTGMQRILQDSKTKVDFTMYFATLVLLNCVEKSTWAFKAWEQDNLRPLWPLEKEPGTFTQQGYIIADLLRMLLGIRKALPQTACGEDGTLITEEQDPLIKGYFEKLHLDFAMVQSMQEKPTFSPTDPRSFQLLFCSTLLLPSKD